MSEHGWFRELFLAEYDRLCRYARSGGASRAEAEEIVQDTFAAVWRSPTAVQQADSPTAYLHGAVRHALMNRQRHRRVVARLHEQARVDAHSPGVSMASVLPPDRLTEQRALAEAVRVALAALPSRGREALLLQRDSGLSYAEIASVMGVSASTVKTHVARALDALRQHLAPWRDDGAPPTPTDSAAGMSADARGEGPCTASPPLAASSPHDTPLAHRP